MKQPMILIGGSVDSHLVLKLLLKTEKWWIPGAGSGSSLCAILQVLFSTDIRISLWPAKVEMVPEDLKRLYKTSIFGRPGPCYLDLVITIS